MIFYLGTHKSGWLHKADFPLFVSRRRIMELRNYRPALVPWILDSGGFTELELHGGWSISTEDYADQVRRIHEGFGNLDGIAPMDWMCEPNMILKTGKSVREHQKLTTENYLRLRELLPGLPVFPVLQGWREEDYHAHVEEYRACGIELSVLPRVGVGSVCRRQGSPEITKIVRGLAALGLSLHLFGVKEKGLRSVSQVIRSSDSMSWSYHARRRPPLEGCPHKNCANCLRYAAIYRERLLRGLPREQG